MCGKDKRRMPGRPELRCLSGGLEGCRILTGWKVTPVSVEVSGPDTTIIIITAYDWSVIEQSAREAGPMLFIQTGIFTLSLYNTLLSVTGIGRAVEFPFSTVNDYAADGKWRGIMYRWPRTMI